MTVEQISILISASAEQAIAQLDLVAQKVNALAGGKPFSLLLSTDQAEEKLAALARTAKQLLTDLNGSQTTAAALAKAQNHYSSAIHQLQTLKSLSRTTYEQELEYLQAISDAMRQYNLSTKDALDLERRLLEVQSRIAARDAQSLDALLDGMISALSARYETMRDAELSMLNQSRAAWQTWQESSTQAIQAQIDALDQLSQAEHRATGEEEHLRRIEKLSQALQYEQDGFNREQLARQLTAAQAEYAAWLVRTVREDEKAALQKQLSAVNERTQAEAEKELMTGTQQDILSLIAQFAPDYNAAGQTLGEQLLEGFAGKVGSIEGWEETLNRMIAGVQQSLNLAMQNAAESFYLEHSGAAAAAAGVTITQQNTFNTPVESPAETAWRIRLANEQLAAQLLEG